MSENNSQTKGILLPGVAAIALYMLFMAGINAFGALRGMFRTPPQITAFSPSARCSPSASSACSR